MDKRIDNKLANTDDKMWNRSDSIDKRIDLESEKYFHLTSPVELISFHGPHFGDRYGIAYSAFKALDDQEVRILIAACSGAAVYIVMPQKKLQEARLFLAEAFEAP